MSEIKSFFPSFEGRSVLVTGHTGFKGTWLCQWLLGLNAEVSGISLAQLPSDPCHFAVSGVARKIRDCRQDVRNREEVSDLIQTIKPDYVFHLAAQSLVGEGYSNAIGTFETNLNGTINLLEALKTSHRPCIAVIITSDKCYENMEWVWGYRETDRLGGQDPYSASKACAEIAIKSFVDSFLTKDGPVRVGIARAGNVIGGGDWAPGRIVPDCVRAWTSGKIVELRNPNSTRPWQHVLEPLGGYLRLARCLEDDPSLHGEAFNFGPSDATPLRTKDLVDVMANGWPGARWRASQPAAQAIKESGLLRLNCDKAMAQLDWRARLKIDEVAQMTVDWYRTFTDEPHEVPGVTNSQILEYQEKLVGTI